MNTKTFTQKPLVFLLMVFFAVSCSNETQKKINVNPEFASYISAYTSGIVSKDATIRIQLANDYTGDVSYTEPISRELFSFEPEIKGKAYWLGRNSIEFIPDEHLPNGTKFLCTFKLGELIDIKDELKNFTFQFMTIQQNYVLYVDGLNTPDISNLKSQALEGRVVTADVADSIGFAKFMEVKQDGKSLSVIWFHDGGNVHRFIVKDVSRRDKESQLKITMNGKFIGVDDVQEKTVEVPALGDFKITSFSVMHEPEQYVLIHFSDPLKINQDLRGLITIQGVSNLSFVVDGHQIRAYPSYRVSGKKMVRVNPGVRNSMDYKMKLGDEIELSFEGLKPAVRFVGDGAVIPSTEQGFVLPFEAVNLRAVDVYVTKVFENNIIQFLQNNHLSGNYEMARVSREVSKKRVDLTSLAKVNLSEWNRFSLDLSTIVSPDPGAIYQIKLDFNRSYSVYGCAEASREVLHELEADTDDDSWNEKGWTGGGYYYDDYYDDYYYDDYYNDYDYRERNNPCHNTYYYDRSITTNVLASDLGIIAKAGADKKMHVFINDIRTAQPLSGVMVEFYDFQQQQIGSATTNSEGMLVADLVTKPFVLVAKSGKQRGYLKLRDGESLSLSKFDVSGETVQKGVKGFLYGERGVWRPGDSIYLTFMIEDKAKVLPSNHPVLFEFINPQGQMVFRRSITKNLNGVYDLRTATDEDAITGSYLAKVKVGNRYFTKYLKVETVKPNRLKMYLDVADKKLTESSTVNLSAKWLHGAIAKNLKAKVDVTVNQSHTTFKGFDSYVFDDPLKSYHTDMQTVFDGKLDQNGEALFAANISIGNEAPGMLNAFFVTKVFEEGGSFSIDRTSATYSPYNSYVGVKVPKGDLYAGTLETDKDHTIEIATVNEAGKALSQKNVEVKVYKIEWRWWWDSYNYNLANYIANTSSALIFNKKVNTTSGKGSVKFRINRPEWGRYLVTVKDPMSGHTTGKIFYVDWPYWARSNRKDNENASMLTFSSDKESYTVGEKVKLSFPSPSDGRALISIESGTKIVQKFWTKTTKGETKYEFEVTPDMTPNVFVHISLIQPHKATENDMPIRLYGVVPITVEDPATHLNPVVKMPDVLRPETKVKVNVTEKDGKEMTYTLAIVDEGLLDLTSYKTPNPWKHFYAREALGVRTWDMYNSVMGAYGAQLDRLLAVGGDADELKRKPAKANRFKPMVRFVGPFHLKKGKSASHEIEIPNYIGSVRVMVVARQEARYGHSEVTVPVRKPLMVLATLPRVLGPKEVVQLPVNIFAMENHVKDVTVEVVPNEMFKLTGSKIKNVKFAKPGDEVVNFELEVTDKIGVGKVKVITRSGKETATDEIEIDIRVPNPRITESYETVLEPGETWDKNFSRFGVYGTNKATVEVSAIPPMDLERRLRYLVTYPHGCVEQTTSAAFPQLALDKVMELSNDYKIAIDRNINAALQRLNLFQTASGGLSYWPGNTDENDWGTTYAGHFMLEAEAKGYSLPPNMKRRWIAYQQKAARDWTRDKSKINSHSGPHFDDLSQAYRLYTLALANSPELGAMNRLKELPSLSLPAKWRLAAAYALAGQNEVAKKLVTNSSTQIPEYIELSYNYGSNVRDEAMILETLVLLKDKARAASLATEIARRMSEDRWYSTQTTAYSILAISKYLGTSPSSKVMNFNYTLNGANAVNKKTQTTLYVQEVKGMKATNQFSLKNLGQGVVYIRLLVEGIPAEDNVTASSNNLSMQVRYLNMDGSSMDVSRVEQGTDFIAEVTVSNPGTKGYLREMALHQMFAAGWEIHNSRMDDITAIANSYFDYRDIRDDRVYTYYQMRSGESKTFRVQLNATYLGKFYLPTLYTEAMYDHTINARIPGRWVEVVRSGVVAKAD
ncbi:MAG: alpha-2-macroglobulin family protein [Flavobacteriales bacterium]